MSARRTKKLARGRGSSGKDEEDGGAAAAAGAGAAAPAAPRTAKTDRIYAMKTKDRLCRKSLIYYDDDTVEVFGDKGDCIRILSYNVHGFYDRKGHNTLDEICEILLACEADVIVLQEFSLWGKRKLITADAFAKDMRRLGYKHIHFDRKEENFFLMKTEFMSDPSFELVSLGIDPIRKVGRSAIICSGVHDGNPLTIVGTHLDVFDESGTTRIRQANTILSKLKGKEEERVMIVGDLNSLLRSDYDTSEWRHITRLDSERRVTTPERDAPDVFEEADYHDTVMSDVMNPCSVWANRRVDYIFANFESEKTGYIGRIACSDHHPVWVDMNLD